MEVLSSGISYGTVVKLCVDCVAVSIQLRFCCTQVIKPERAWVRGCAFCLLPTQPVSKAMPFAICSDSYSRSNPGNVLLLMEYLDIVSP